MHIKHDKSLSVSEQELRLELKEMVWSDTGLVQLSRICNL